MLTFVFVVRAYDRDSKILPEVWKEVTHRTAHSEHAARRDLIMAFHLSALVVQSITLVRTFTPA